MNKTSLTGLLRTLITLIGQNNDLLSVLIRNSYNTISSVDPFSKRMSEQPDIFLNSKETCDLLKCSNVTLWKLRKSNKIPFFKINGAVRFRRTDVINYITKADCYES